MTVTTPQGNGATGRMGVSAMMTESRQGDERAPQVESAGRTRRLRVAMDVQSLQTARTGVRTYVDELLREFARPDAPHQVVPLAGPKRLPSRVRLFRIINQAMYFPWLHLWLPLRLWLGRYDVLFSPEYLTARWTPAPRVVTFHDAMFLRRPQDYNRLWLGVFRWVSLPALRRSAAVIVPSRHAAEETATYAGVSPDRIHVVPQGGPTGGEPMRVAEAEAAPVLARYGLAPGAYVLHVGVLERRKNLVTLVRAFDQYRRLAAEGNDGTPAGWKLVLVGQPGPRPDLDDSQNIRRTIAELGMENEVILTGHVSIAERNALYTRAGAVAVPSLLEGFGIPVLEAFAAGVPVLSARSTSLPEVAGDAALYFDPGSVDELAGAIARVAGDAGLRARLVVAGTERVREFTWARTAAETMAVFEAVARGHTRP
jgi:glycosyltransferase involved in cell wall biosynthesis